MSDLVNHPAHYEEQSIKLEPIDFCERLSFCEGNALKYCFRAGHKEGSSELQDLKKSAVVFEALERKPHSARPTTKKTSGVFSFSRVPNPF